MIEDPGSLSGIFISPIPARGPEASRRISFAIFVSDTAMPLSVPCVSTIALCVASASNLFCAGVNGNEVSLAISAVASLSKSLGALSPVPIAVPPSASSARCGSVFLIAISAWSSIETYPESSWPRVIGVASIICVRPIFTTCAYSFDFESKTARSFSIPGIVVSIIILYPAICIAVGNTSLDD